MTHDIEEELRQRLRVRAAGFDLAPGAVTAAAEQGRRRLRRRRSVAGSAVVLAVAVGITAGFGWDSRTEDPAVVMAPAPTPAATSPDSAQAPRLITRTAGSGNRTLLAGASGTLVVTTNDCVALAPPDGQQPWGIIWGPGWSAAWEDGKAVVHDPTGALFAREGDRVGLTGGGGGATAASLYSKHPCWTDNMFEANDTLGATAQNEH